ncbi:MAG: ImmA/IrrE family metallo-endopeptidase [Spirosoma sp.]|nr:ImmA/IrrE family metallo-endopeptidase [Spirosoma sp.]
MSSEAYLGQRLAALRNLQGITQDELAVNLGVSASFLAAVTKGNKKFPDSLAAAAAERYRVPLTFFKVRPDPADIGPVTFKKTSAARKRDEDRVIELYNEAARLARHASQLSGWREVSLPHAPDYDGDPEEIATAVRNAAGLLATQPIENMTRTVERLGVTVVHRLDPDDADDSAHAGASRPSPWSTRPLIGLAATLAPAKKRHTIAHELFHIIAHQGLDVAPTKVRDPRERAADRFARALMLPAEVALHEISESLTLQGYLKLKMKYGMGVDVLIKRGEDLGLLTSKRARSLYIQWSSHGWRTKEPVNVIDEVPVLLGQALQRAHGRAYAMKASHITGVSADLIRLWVGPAVDPPADDDLPSNVLRLPGPTGS